MEVRIVHDTDAIYEFLECKTRFNYVYQLNNLSPHIWGKVVCYGLFEKTQLQEIAMINMNYHIPVLLAAGFDNMARSKNLIDEIKNFLPARFYTHIDGPVLDKAFSQYKTTERDNYINMGLQGHEALSIDYDSEAVRLGLQDLTTIKELLSVSYSEAWLDDELVGLNENFGIFHGEKLISFAGIHAYSEHHGVAAIAHVATHPDFRKKGYGERTVKALVNSLGRKMEYIGLNVKVDNLPAINCYKKLGFRNYGTFVACEVETIGGNS